MDKTAIKKFATIARIKLINAVKQRAYELGVTEDEIKEPSVYEDGFSINGQIFRKEEIDQRTHLLSKLQSTSYEEVIEEVVYTWFNRFIAIRFMEVNDYLPTGIRLLSSVEHGKTEPDALTEVSFLIEELQLDRDYVYELEDEHNHNQLFKYIIIQQCNQLGELMPLVFEEITGYTALLLPDYLLAENSVLTDLVEMITEDNWQDVEIIGWLYQYYNADVKDEVFADLRKNIKISKQSIPAATQLFTPRWIVQYMVDNSLGRYWIESHDNNKLKDKLTYYLDDAEQPAEVVKKLNEITEKNIHPEHITFLDPSMGSGHVLIYAFEVFYEIYLSQGYRSQDIPKLILERNLFGLEIDDRATQLAYFALMMKAREYNHRIFQSPVHLNIYAIQDSTAITDEDIELFTNNDESLLNVTTTLIETFKNGKLLGSIIEVSDLDIHLLEKRISEIEQNDYQDLFMNQFKSFTLPIIDSLVKQTILLQKKYDIVVTNPPYMGRRGMNAELAKYVRKHYKDASADMFAVFKEVTSHFTKNHGYIGMINQHAWMFLSSYEKLRKKILNNHQIYSMAHLGTRAFSEIGGEVVQTTSYVLRKKTIKNYIGTFIRLTEVNDSEKKSVEFFNRSLHYFRRHNSFTDIPGSPIAYWASNQVFKIFRTNSTLGDISEPKQGLATANNNKFLRLWFEVNISKIGFNFTNRDQAKNSSLKWFPYNKGGAYRKWYGNLEYLVNWQNDGFEIRNFKDSKGKVRSRPQNMEYYFKEGISWSFISSSYFGVRYTPNGFVFDVGGSSLFPDKGDINQILSFLTSKVASYFLAYLNPTLNFQVGNISNLPIVSGFNHKNEISHLTETNISLSKSDWDAFETSWDFEEHPFIQYKNEARTIEEAYNNWAAHADKRFYTLKENEEKLNGIFIDLYGLQDELTPEVEDKDVTVRKADQERDVKSYLSYLVGVMFGRYSLDEKGLVFAGGYFDLSRYETFTPDVENIIPITDKQYFEDDIVTRVIKLTKLIFGETHLEDNLTFIADTLTRRRNETARERIRRYFLKEFYRDHLQTYQKRPIYWQIDSGGKNDGFKALIYIHRYQPDLLSRVRTQYLHPQIKKYENEINRLQMTMESDVSQPEKTRAKKEQHKIEKQVLECQAYDQILAHMAHQVIDIDLDDGIKVNHERFQAIDMPQSDEIKSKKANIFTKL